mgnify:FL=1
MIRTILSFAFPIIFVAALSGQTTYYTVKFPDDETVYGCGAVPDTTWPVITQYGNCNFNVGVSVKDQKFYTNATGGCYKILRTWKLLYWCDYDPNWPSPYYISNPTSTDIGPVVTGDMYNHGYLQYTQIIKVVDTEAPYFLNCPTGPVTFCDLTDNDPNQYHSGWTDYCEGPVNLNIKVKDACSGTDITLTYRLFLDLDNNGSMETLISSSAPTAWPIVTSTQGDTLSAMIGFPPGFGLPYGSHKVEWIANDKCGNEAICKFEFIVKDCKAPTVVCHNGLSINIMPTGMITIWDTDFIQYYSDNCTPTSQIKYAIQKAGAGTTFPDGNHSVTFDCSELGKQFVEIWVEDAYGNADFCKTFIDVQDNAGVCPPSTPFKGTVATDNSKSVQGVTVSLLKGTQPVATAETGDDGQYAFGSMTAGCNYKLVPALDQLDIDGVNTLDALLVAGQLDDIISLSSPYQLLAADVDKSANVTAADLSDMIKVILGLKSSFAGTTSWQFIPASYVFPDPLNPWSVSAPSSLKFCLSGDIDFDPNFVAVKTGDINSSSVQSSLLPDAVDRSLEKGTATFTTVERTFKAGDVVNVDITTPDLGNIAAFQFTLEYNPTVLSTVSLGQALVPADFMATPQEARVTACWYDAAMLDPTVQAKNAKFKAFSLQFTALQDGKLSEVLQMTSAITPAQAYNRQMETLDAQLQFLPGHPGKKNPEFFIIQPNPVVDAFSATYFLPEAGPVTLTLTDATGRIMQTIQANKEAGYHQADLNLDKSTQPGMFFLHLNGPGGTDVQRVMKR